MRSRPILFSAPMVRAILDGTKTQTRRVIKHQPPADVAPITVGRYHPTVVNRHGEEEPGPEIFGAYDSIGEWGCKCCYGEPGDRLWVRESFQPLFAKGVERADTDYGNGQGYAVRYVATDGATEWVDGDDNITMRCTPSIHMPRWASRITLEITGVRVERLSDISSADAAAEGVSFGNVTDPETGEIDRDACEAFEQLWESINGPGSWDANPWVWVVEFKRVAQEAQR